MKHFKTLTELTKYVGFPAPEHPMIMAMFFDPTTHLEMGCSTHVEPEELTSDLYMIFLKSVKEGELKYGRTKYDFTNGALIFTAPRQITQWSGEIEIDQRGFAITFHEDFIKGHPLADQIKKYGFFSYSANEALHLSPNEEQTIMTLVENIEAEYQNNHDEFSKEIMLSHLETLLKYSDRFYKRQFIHRKETESDLESKFTKVLRNYFEEGKFEENGIPSIEMVAEELSVTSRYLSDSLKAETGKSALEHIHLYLIDEAKNLLLKPHASVSETAYQLGFEYPHYFSRLFKKKVGVSPTKYQQQYTVN